MAETGAIGYLSAEIQTAPDAGNVLAIMQGSGLGMSAGTVIVEQFSVNTDFPLVTLTTMIARARTGSLACMECPYLMTKDNGSRSAKSS